MPVSVDDPFLLTSYSSTSHRHQKLQAVHCTPEQRNVVQVKSEEEHGSCLLAVAVQGEGVQLFNTADQKCVFSYSAAPGYSFTGSAQTIQKSGKLRHVYAVIAKGTDVPTKEEGKVVWRWVDETSTASDPSILNNNDVIESVRKPSSARKTVHKFESEIYQLFVSSLLPNHAVLVNKDGSLVLVTEDMKRIVSSSKVHSAPGAKANKKDKKDKSTQDRSNTVLWATTYNTTGSWIPTSSLPRETLIVMTVVEPSVETMVITLSYVNKEQRGFTEFGQVELKSTTGSPSFAFDAVTGQFSFLTASGELKIYQVAVDQVDHTLSAIETLTLPLPGYAAISTARTGVDPLLQSVDTIALGDNYLAVAGIHNNNDKPELVLTIWDIQYGTLQAKHLFPGVFSLQNSTCQLALLPGSVLVITISTTINTTVKSDVYLCHFYAEPMSLLGAMGRMKDTTPFLGQSGAIAQDAYTSTTTSLLVPSDTNAIVKGSDLTKGKDEFEKQFEAAQMEEKKVLEALASKSHAGDAQAFEEVFFKYMDQQTAAARDDVLKRHGVSADEVKEAVEATKRRKAETKKLLQQQQSNQKKDDSDQKMEVDNEPAVKDNAVTIQLDKAARKKLKKKEANAAKAASKEATKADNEAGKDGSKKATKASTKKSKPVAKEAANEDGSSSESSSDEDDENQVVVLSSDDENKEEEDETEYKADLEEEHRLEAHRDAVEQWRKIEADAIKNYNEQRRLLAVGRAPIPPPELSHHFVITVISYCFPHLPNGQPDMSFWPSKVIKFMIEHQLVGNANPGAGQAGIALNLMERGQWHLLELAFKKLYDIPEGDMIVMLKQVISLNRKTSISTSARSQNATGISGVVSQSLSSSTTTKSKITSTSIPDIPYFLNLIMTAPRNEIFMQQALKKLTVEELTVVLEILKGWIDIWDVRGGIGHQNQRADKKQLPGGLPGYGI
ncbi:hypothetical protein BX616_003625, partial [Lobosporangium transversale]